jgi:hypothetical protein
MNTPGYDAPKREAEVSNQIGQLEKTVEEIFQTINDLRNRISPILKQDIVGKSTPEKATCNLVPLAATIYQCCNKISGCSQEIREIIEACEL